MNKADLPLYVLRCLQHLDGRGTVLEVSKKFYELFSGELTEAEDLFYTWQYDIRWAATELRKNDLLLKSSNVGEKNLWILPDNLLNTDIEDSEYILYKSGIIKSDSQKPVKLEVDYNDLTSVLNYIGYDVFAIFFYDFSDYHEGKKTEAELTEIISSMFNPIPSNICQVANTIFENKKENEALLLIERNTNINQQYSSRAREILYMRGYEDFLTESILEQPKESDKQPKIKLEGNNAKTEAIKYLKTQGISLYETVTYSTRQEKRDEFWANPSIDVINKNWSLVLHNPYRHKLFIFNIPADSFSIDQGNNRLNVRADRTDKIELKFNSDFLDSVSKQNLKPFLIATVEY